MSYLRPLILIIIIVCPILNVIIVVSVVCMMVVVVDTILMSILLNLGRTISGGWCIKSILHTVVVYCQGHYSQQLFGT